MRRRTPLFQALEPAVVSSGLQPDQHNLKKVLWEAAANVSFAAGKIRRKKGPALAYAGPAAPVRGLSQQQATNGTRWLWSAIIQAPGMNIYRWYGPTSELLFEFGGGSQVDESLTTPATFVDFLHYGDWTIINYGSSPWIYKPGVSASGYGNAPAGAVKFMKKLSFVLAVGYGDRGTRVGWSDSGNIEEWTATAENSAGALSIDDFDTRIRAACYLGSSIAVFAEDQMALVNYISAPFYFGQRFALDGVGAVGKMAVATDGRQVFGVGRGGVWWTDGNSYRYIDEGYLHDYLQDGVNWAQASKIVAARNDYTGCFEFYFPMGASLNVNEGWSFDPRTGGWSPVPPVSVKDERKLFQYPIIGTHDGKVQLDDYDPAWYMPLTLRTRPLLMQLQSQSGITDLHQDVQIDEIELLLHTASWVQMRIGSSQEAAGAYTWSDWIDVSPGQGTITKDPSWPGDGVFWKLEFRSEPVAEALGWTLDLQGFMLFGSFEGSKRD